ncbi:hypothetical protein CHS0354_027627 [Potamilus streckersoni]|uniref:SAM domain-containing protein n=1 Tax=Potamilus streckersoni TaxID=2493646 RepID=A0AAE0W481_9BIVA|nr:hypothetical protein CHS0354_027627 [Potamilus streckersoni]
MADGQEILMMKPLQHQVNGTTVNGTVSNGKVSNGKLPNVKDSDSTPSTPRSTDGLRNLPPIPNLKEDILPPLPPNPPKNSEKYLSQRIRSGYPPRSQTTLLIPEHDIVIPKDGSLYEFSTDDMSTFLRYFGIEERIISHVHKKGLDGKRFSRMKDSDLEILGMKNPLICHFRDRSIKEKIGKNKMLFVL